MKSEAEIREKLRELKKQQAVAQVYKENAYQCGNTMEYHWWLGEEDRLSERVIELWWVLGEWW